jgi:acyl carrier protein
MQDPGHSGITPLLLQLVEENAGIRLQPSDCDANFFELGLDSLFLTQFSVSLVKRFGVNVTFRQLSSEFGNVRKLAAFLDGALAGRTPTAVTSDREDTFAPTVAGRPAASHAPLHARPERQRPNASDPLIRLFLSQIDVMQQQLDALGQTIGVAASPDPVGTIASQEEPAAGGEPAQAEQRSPASAAASGAASAMAPVIAPAAASAVPLLATAAARPLEAAHPAAPMRSAEVQASATAPAVLATLPPAVAGPAMAASAAPAGREAGGGAMLDAARPPVPGARLGRDPAGQPAWFVPRAGQPGKFVKLD